MVVDLRTGRLAHGLWIESEIEELYDVVMLPDVRWPAALGADDNESGHAIVPGPLAEF